MYSVRWIAQHGNEKPYSSGINYVYKSIEEAEDEIEFQIENQEKNLLAIWIDELEIINYKYEVVDTKNLRVFINAVGSRIK